MKLVMILWFVSLGCLSLIYAQDEFGTYTVFGRSRWQKKSIKNQDCGSQDEIVYPTIIPAFTDQNLPDRRSIYTWLRYDEYCLVDRICQGLATQNSLYPVVIRPGSDNEIETNIILLLSYEEFIQKKHAALQAEYHERRRKDPTILSMLAGWVDRLWSPR